MTASKTQGDVMVPKSALLSVMAFLKRSGALLKLTSAQWDGLLWRIKVGELG